VFGGMAGTCPANARCCDARGDHRHQSPPRGDGPGRAVPHHGPTTRRGSRPAPNRCGRLCGGSRSGHAILHDPECVPWRFRCAKPVDAAGWRASRRPGISVLSHAGSRDLDPSGRTGGHVPSEHSGTAGSAKPPARLPSHHAQRYVFAVGASPAHRSGAAQSWNGHVGTGDCMEEWFEHARGGGRPRRTTTGA